MENNEDLQEQVTELNHRVELLAGMVERMSDNVTQLADLIAVLKQNETDLITALKEGVVTDE